MFLLISGTEIQHADFEHVSIFKTSTYPAKTLRQSMAPVKQRIKMRGQQHVGVD